MSAEPQIAQPIVLRYPAKNLIIGILFCGLISFASLGVLFTETAGRGEKILALVLSILFVFIAMIAVSQLFRRPSLSLDPDGFKWKTMTDEVSFGWLDVGSLGLFRQRLERATHYYVTFDVIEDTLTEPTAEHTGHSQRRQFRIPANFRISPDEQLNLMQAFQRQALERSGATEEDTMDDVAA